MAHETGIGAQHLTFGSLFRIFFWTSLALWVLLGGAVSSAALFGADTVNWNGQPVYGVAGLTIGLAITVIIGAILSLMSAVLTALLVKIFGGLLPLGNLRSTKQSFSDVATVFSEDS